MTREQWINVWRWARIRKRTMEPWQTKDQLMASNMRYWRDQPTPARVQVLPF